MAVKMTSDELTSVKMTSVKTKPDKLTYERNFGHIIIYWKIKNFSLAICNSEAEICTDEFDVTYIEFIRWVLGFRVESDGSMLRFFLRRIGGETEVSLKVSWKITILNGKNEATFVSLNKAYFVKDSENTIVVIPPFEILRLLPAEKSDEVNVEFQMIVLMNTAMFIPTPRDVGILSLVEDMRVIAKEGLLHDLTVILNGKCLTIHKAVVSPRSKRLCPSTGYQSKKLHLHLSEYDSVNSVMTYLYTGDLKSILDPPSISIYEYIIHLDIKELRNAYPQEKIFLETAAEATNYEFRWVIKDFNCSDELRESEIYEANGTGVKWQLRIYPKEMDEETEMKRKYIYIEALAVSCDNPQDIFVNFIAKNDKGMITIAKRTYGKVTTGTKLGVFFMRIGSPSMAKSVIDNVFDVIFGVHTATGEIHSKIIKTEPPVTFTLTNFDTFKIMSNYLGLQQSDSTYSDITLVVQDQEIKAHKFLLAGRSEIFSRMMEGMKNDNTTLPLHNMHKHVFRVFVDYLYTAALTDKEIGVLIHLHDIACHFQVKSLQTVCVKHLSEQITTENCCYLLLFSAERQYETLKTNILKYLSTHREIIIHTEGWRRLEDKNPQLFYEAICYLGDQPVVPARNVQR